MELEVPASFSTNSVTGTPLALVLSCLKCRVSLSSLVDWNLLPHQTGADGVWLTDAAAGTRAGMLSISHTRALLRLAVDR